MTQLKLAFYAYLAIGAALIMIGYGLFEMIWLSVRDAWKRVSVR